MSDFRTARHTQYSPELETALRILEAEAANFARVFIQDSNARFYYMRETQAMSARIRADYLAGRVTASGGARQAQELRNLIMKATRLKSSSIGNAVAYKTKKKGRTLGELLEKYARKKFQKPFLQLNANQQNKVYLEIIESAGRPDHAFNALSTKMSRFSKGFAVLTIGIAVYNITTAEDKVEATAREGVTIGGGILGGMGAGAATGLVCGPGAPVCSTVLVFVGGALGAFGADAAFSWFTK